jgi:basic membrane protein A
VVALASVLVLALGACGDRPDDDDDAGSAPESTPTTTEGETSAPPPANPDFKACMVSDSGGFDDKSFNQTSHDGLVNAKTNLGVQTGEIESQSDSEYPDNINALVREDCNIIVTVGFLLGEATEKAAKANKNVDFAIVDFGYAKPPPNLRGLGFNTAQPAFMAGYLAAGMTQTGVVGTFGGVEIPTVTIFMDGFWEGVQYWNEQKDDDVQVVGWDEESQKGVFTNDFEKKNLGQNAANDLISQSADIIMPVAGPAGLGALDAAQDSDGAVTAIWVDTDGCVSAAEYCDVLLSSVMKNMHVAVEDAITDSANGEFDNTPYVGTLENQGVQLAPFNEFEDEVPQELKDELEEIQAGLIDGSIPITSPAAPQ